MPQLTLYAPDITCDHCIATISRAVGAVEGARFLAGDPQTRAFAVEVGSGAALDRVAAALAAEGYPLGEAPPPGVPAPGAHQAQGAHTGPFRPDYLKVERTAAGAEITYSCPCGSTTEVFHLDRAQPDQAPHSCCGHHLLVGANAAERLRTRLGDRYAIDVQTLTMPWGQPVETAMAGEWQ
ncbi:MAG: copper chaperone [Dehalococcoidia bacterium]|nr:copper chaperone [Dehalococcoidia bacterium]